jgi:hypothetical protein
MQKYCSGNRNLLDAMYYVCLMVVTVTCAVLCMLYSDKSNPLSAMYVMYFNSGMSQLLCNVQQPAITVYFRELCIFMKQ